MQITRCCSRAKSIIKADACIKFYDETKPLYLETDTSGVGLGASLLQTRNGTMALRPIAFTSKSLSSAEKRYSNIESEALGILHGQEEFHYYCFAREMSITTDLKPLVAIFKKDMQHYCKDYSDYSSEYTNTESK